MADIKYLIEKLHKANRLLRIAKRDYRNTYYCKGSNRHARRKIKHKINKFTKHCLSLKIQIAEFYTFDDLSTMDWFESTVENFGRTLNISYGMGEVDYSKDHGHIAIDLETAIDTYNRPIDQPHGFQNYADFRNFIAATN